MSDALPPFEVRIAPEGDTICLGLEGELDFATVGRLNSALAQVATEHPAAPVRIDLRGLEFIDSSGMSALMMASTAVSSRGGKLTVVRGPDAVQKSMEVIGLEQILEFVDS